jgi:hypothetical protein
MAAPETVRVYSKDENNDPISGILVRFFDGSDNFVTQQITSLVGYESYAEVTLDGDNSPIEYTIRLSKVGVSFDGTLGDDSKTPQSIDVYSPASLSPTSTNNFEVQGQAYSRPAASDPRICRCSGYFIDHRGQPLKNLEMHFIALCMNDGQSPWNPLIVDGKAVLSVKIYSKTDSRGYMEIDLFRMGIYQVLVQGIENSNRVVKVPDTAGVNIVDLLFPVVEEVTFSINPVTISPSSYVDLDVSVVATDGQELLLSSNDVIFESQNLGVAVVQIVDNKLRVMGLSVGTTTITARRADTSTVTIPTQPVTYIPLSVTVS